MTDLEWKKFYKEHKSGMSIPQLSKKYRIHAQSFYAAFKRLSLIIIPKPPDKGANYNHNFFNKIDSELKAYLLGWLMSDGYVTTRHRVGIKLNKKDIEIIELFRKSIAPNASILKDIDSRVIQFHSKELFNAVIKLGIMPNKTYLETHIPNIKNKFIRHFIRGYFDGDGSISISKNNKVNWNICSINKVILNEMGNEMNCFGIKTSITMENRSHLNYKNMYRIHIIGSIKNKHLAFNYFYRYSKYFLKRKFIKLNNLYGNTEVRTKNKNFVTP